MPNEKTPEGQPPCRDGIKTDNPCWRPATERRFRDDEEPTLCAEHAHLCRLTDEQDAWNYALDNIEEWMRGPVSEDPYGHLDRLVTNMRDEARREYARGAAAVRAAEIVAEQGPPEEGEPVLTLEQSEKLARILTRTDSFVNARTLVEDAPEEVLEQRDRWAIVDALEMAAVEAGEEFERYKEEIGLKDGPPPKRREAHDG